MLIYDKKNTYKIIYSSKYSIILFISDHQSPLFLIPEGQIKFSPLRIVDLEIFENLEVAEDDIDELIGLHALFT